MLDSASSLNADRSSDQRIVIFKLGGSLLSLADLAARIGVVLSHRSDLRCALVVGGGAAADLVREWDRTHRVGEEAAHWLALRAMQLTAEFVAALLPGFCIVKDRASLASAWASGQFPLLEADAWLREAERRIPLSPASRIEDTTDSIGGEGRGEGQESCILALPSSGLRPPSPRDALLPKSSTPCGEKGADEGESEHPQRGCTIPHTWDLTSDSIAGWLATELDATELVLLKSVARPTGDMTGAAQAGLVDRCFPDAAARIPQVSWANLRSEHCRIESWIAR